MKRLFCLFLMLVLAAGCEGFLKPEIIDVEDFEIEGLTLNQLPRPL